jgi:hypothetical protein
MAGQSRSRLKRWGIRAPVSLPDQVPITPPSSRVIIAVEDRARALPPPGQLEAIWG